MRGAARILKQLIPNMANIRIYDSAAIVERYEAFQEIDQLDRTGWSCVVCESWIERVSSRLDKATCCTRCRVALHRARNPKAPPPRPAKARHDAQAAKVQEVELLRLRAYAKRLETENARLIEDRGAAWDANEALQDQVRTLECRIRRLTAGN